MHGLSDTDRAMLSFAGRHWIHPGAKEAAIREEFDVSPTRFYQRLLALLQRPEALAYSPVLVNRLRRRYGRRVA